MMQEVATLALMRLARDCCMKEFISCVYILGHNEGKIYLLIPTFSAMFGDLVIQAGGEMTKKFQVCITLGTRLFL
jgi:hypothetical protein